MNNKKEKNAFNCFVWENLGHRVIEIKIQTFYYAFHKYFFKNVHRQNREEKKRMKFISGMLSQNVSLNVKSTVLIFFSLHWCDVKKSNFLLFLRGIAFPFFFMIQQGQFHNHSHSKIVENHANHIYQKRIWKIYSREAYKNVHVKCRNYGFTFWRISFTFSFFHFDEVLLRYLISSATGWLNAYKCLFFLSKILHTLIFISIHTMSIIVYKWKSTLMVNSGKSINCNQI